MGIHLQTLESKTIPGSALAFLPTAPWYPAHAAASSQGIGQTLRSLEPVSTVLVELIMPEYGNTVRLTNLPPRSQGRHLRICPQAPLTVVRQMGQT
jgi:hypothetical protein